MDLNKQLKFLVKSKTRSVLLVGYDQADIRAADPREFGVTPKFLLPEDFRPDEVVQGAHSGFWDAFRMEHFMPARFNCIVFEEIDRLDSPRQWDFLKAIVLDETGDDSAQKVPFVWATMRKGTYLPAEVPSWFMSLVFRPDA